MSEVSTPPVRMKSSTRRPISLSANAVTTAVRSPKARRRPRATLYSPPPSQARKDLAVRIRPSPGSRRSITSPRDTASKRQSDAGRMRRSAISCSFDWLVSWWFAGRGSAVGERDGVGGQRPDAGEVAGLHPVARDHPRATDRGDRRDGQVLRQVPGADPAGGHKTDAAEGGGQGLDRGRAAGGPGREELHGAQAELEGGLDLGRGDRAGQGEHAELAAAFDDGPGQARRDHEPRSEERRVGKECRSR